jgi:hypothetical protein
MAAKTKPSAKSSNPNTSRNAHGTGADRTDRTDRKPARAHRDDTPEARTQRERLPKTHPNSAGRQAAARKARKD